MGQNQRSFMQVPASPYGKGAESRGKWGKSWAPKNLDFGGTTASAFPLGAQNYPCRVVGSGGVRAEKKQFKDGRELVGRANKGDRRGSGKRPGGKKGEGGGRSARVFNKKIDAPNSGKDLKGGGFFKN